jgi:hypothetical protein
LVATRCCGSAAAGWLTRAPAPTSATKKTAVIDRIVAKAMVPSNPLMWRQSIRLGRAATRQLPVRARGIAFGFFGRLWADFAILNEMDSTGSRMIRGAGGGFGSLY